MRRGDTLGRIARRHGTTVGALVAMNSLRQANLIRPGQVLRVPAARTGGGAGRSGTGGAAESAELTGCGAAIPWARIAKRFDTTVDTLVAMNGLARANLIRPQQVLKVPGQRNGRGARRSASRQRRRSRSRYRVRRGDTLGHIARRHGTTVDMLVAMNGLDAATIIKPGQTLRVPVKGRRAGLPLPASPCSRSGRSATR